MQSCKGQPFCRDRSWKYRLHGLCPAHINLPMHAMSRSNLRTVGAKAQGRYNCSSISAKIQIRISLSPRSRSVLSILSWSKNFFTGNTRFYYRATHFLFVEITLRRIQMTVSDFQSVENASPAFLFRHLIHSVSELRHFHSVAQSYIFHFLIPQNFFIYINSITLSNSKGNFKFVYRIYLKSIQKRQAVV